MFKADALQSQGHYKQAISLYQEILSLNPSSLTALRSMAKAQNADGHPQDAAATIKKVAILRPGATTHAVHMDDYRYVPLKFTVGTGQLTVTAPANANLAPPGYYMLVILNAKGVPSVMPFVLVN